MGRRLKVYLGGPEVFLSDAAAVAAGKIERAAAFGFAALCPLGNPPADARDDRIDVRIFRANVALLREADFGIFNLTPFRGISADVGTVFELGMLTGLGRRVFAYTNDPADLVSRARDCVAGTAFDAATGTWCDADGMQIEDYGNADNLMLDCALCEQDTPIVRHPAAAQERFRDLTGFETCLRLAAEIFRDEA
ncbi:MAG: nucleoside 2-deoxyribosyltransferase [Rhodospirillales bacterium]